MLVQKKDAFDLLNKMAGTIVRAVFVSPQLETTPLTGVLKILDGDPKILVVSDDEGRSLSWVLENYLAFYASSREAPPELRVEAMSEFEGTLVFRNIDNLTGFGLAEFVAPEDSTAI